MSSGSKSLHNSAVPALQWAHSSSSSSSDHPVKPSSPLVSDKLIKEEPTPQQAEVDLRAQPRNLRPRKPRMQGGDAGGPRRSLRNVKETKPRLRISLTEEEIKEDLYSMTGGIPTRKPNKRSQSVKEDIDKLFPGSKLDGIGADNYCAERGFKI